MPKPTTGPHGKHTPLLAEVESVFERGDIVQSTCESDMDIHGEVWQTKMRETGLHIKLRRGKWWKASDFILAKPAPTNAGAKAE